MKQREINSHCREFLTAFAAQLGRSCEKTISPGPRGVCWLNQDAEHLDYLYITEYLSPRYSPEQPHVLRVKFNHVHMWLTKAGLKRLIPEGQKIACRVVGNKVWVANFPWQFELTLLPEELLDFVSWVIALVKAMETGSASLLSVPPHSLGIWQGPIEEWSFVREVVIQSRYAWTLSAWNLKP